MINKEPELDDIEVTPLNDFDDFKERYDPPNWIIKYWFPIILFVLFSVFTIVDHTIMKNKIEEVRQDNLKERIEHSLDWSRMLCRKQELVIDKLYEKRIIRFGTYTHRALDRENKIWLKKQMARKVKNGHK